MEGKHKGDPYAPQVLLPARPGRSRHLLGEPGIWKGGILFLGGKDRLDKEKAEPSPPSGTSGPVSGVAKYSKGLQ